jgi:hypothetical protein
MMRGSRLLWLAPALLAGPSTEHDGPRGVGEGTAGPNTNVPGPPPRMNRQARRGVEARARARR